MIHAALDLATYASDGLPSWTRVAAVVTGALLGAEFGARRGFDVIGVFVLAFAQGLGGLLLLDLLLQTGTPQFLTDPTYLLGTLVAAIVGFYFAGFLGRSARILVVLDALSAGFFVCVGVTGGFALSLPWISCVFLGVLTATGGLVLRDVLAGNSPSLMRPGMFYGIAAFAGAIVLACVYEYTGLPMLLAQAITIGVVLAVRLLSLWRGWTTRPSEDLTDRVWNRWMKAR